MRFRIPSIHPSFSTNGLSATRTSALSVLLITVLLTGGCRDARQTALHQLEERQIAPVAASLLTAVNTKDKTLLSQLATAGVKAELPAKGQNTILQTAAAAGAWDLLPQLIPLCTPEILDHPDAQNQVILEKTVAAGRPDIADLLLNAGAQPGAASDASGLLTASRALPGLTDHLAAKLPLGHPALSSALLESAAAGETASVDLLISRGAHPEAKTAKGGSALTLSCAAGHTEIAARLLKAGAKPAASPAALQKAVEHSSQELVQLLIAAGADPSQPPDPEHPEATPLVTALETCEPSLIGLLLTKSSPSGICYEAAVNKGKTGLLEVLFKLGIVPDQAMSDGNPPLVKAAIDGNAELAASLLAHGAPVDMPGALAQSAYHMAVLHQRNEVIPLLIKAGMPADAPFRKPAPPGLIDLFGNEYFAKFYRKDDNLTPLMLAAARGDGPMIRILLDHGAKRGAQTKEWHRYPIVFACDNARIGAAQLLLGRDPDSEKERRSAVVSLSKQRVSLYKNDVLVRSSSVSTGRKANPTPPGQYVITDKQVDWVSSIYKVPMPYFMRLSCKEIGLHQGVVPGYPASHGCIRMPKSEVIAFFKTLQIGDPVTIEE